MEEGKGKHTYNHTSRKNVVGYFFSFLFFWSFFFLIVVVVVVVAISWAAPAAYGGSQARG